MLVFADVESDAIVNVIADGKYSVSKSGANTHSNSLYAKLLCLAHSIMIHPQVHIRIPCYDFYFL